VALEAVTLLPEDERKILMLAGPGGLTCQELAARFARADGTMKSSLRRARASLAHSLAVVKKPPGAQAQQRSAAAHRIGISGRRGCEPNRPA
jgi:predicted RNA polymerase sigma factor